MRHYALYDHRWTEIHRPEPVPGLLLELPPHLVHSVSSNPVMESLDVTTIHDDERQVSYRPRLGPAPIPFPAPIGLFALR
jgi:hypothetical protein